MGKLHGICVIRWNSAVFFAGAGLEHNTNRLIIDANFCAVRGVYKRIKWILLNLLEFCLKDQILKNFCLQNVRSEKYVRLSRTIF